ncbi:PREDICTED: protein canopy homolog 1 [Dinoponera quadriceps]|uniref:Protein canopy homolog 1 n=1 Tax=Dinoponera quadriceps TaxID=609295 RepID=A0A6P3XX71_DINQU|nr:PREDICTED: protein canopy homolog 1 [Dinoponera quadriceps]
MKVFLLVTLFFIQDFVESTEIDLKHLKCLVCRATMNEVEAKVSKINPKILVEVGNYKMDAQGNQIYKKIPLIKSEVHISDMLDDICQKMNDYVRATKKYNKKLTIFNLMTPEGTMNPQMSKVDIIHDGDLNKSLEYNCNTIIEEFEDDIIKLYVNDLENRKEKLCTEISNICENYPEDDDNDDDNNIDSLFKNKSEL